MRHRARPFLDVASRTSAAYALAGVVWILTSDTLVEWLITSHEARVSAQTYKGWAFVSATAVLLFIALRGQMASRRHAETTLRQMARAVEQSPSSIVITDPAGRIEYVNPKFTEVSGYSLDEVRGQNPRLLKSGHTSPDEYRQMWQAITSGRDWRMEFCNRRKSGETYWESASLSAIHDEDGRISHFVAVKEDITDRRLRERRLEAVAAVGYALREVRSVADVPAIIRQQVGALLESTDATVHLSLPDVAVPADEPETATDHPEWIVPMMSAGQRVGEMRVSKAAGLAEEDLQILAAVADISASAAMREHLHGQLVAAYDATIEGWSRALDLRDRETEGHSRRVTEVTLLLARSMGIPEADLTHIRRGALLHDIGKMGIPDAILLKPGELTAEEWTVMRRHPQHAYDLRWPVAFLRPALDIPLCHHERWDGQGYPRGLKGTAIPLAARIFAVVDVWDALRSDRPYRAAWSDGRVRAHLLGLAGTHLDTAVVAAFIRILDRGDVARAVATVTPSAAPPLPADAMPVPQTGR